jgi:hypothetical protein
VERNLPGIDGRTERLYRQLAAAAESGRLQIGNGVTDLSIRKARALLATGASDDNDRERSDSASGGRRRPSARALAERAITPLIEALGEDSELDRDELVEALGLRLIETSDPVAWACELESVFAEVRELIEETAPDDEQYE